MAPLTPRQERRRELAALVGAALVTLAWTLAIGWAAGRAIGIW